MIKINGVPDHVTNSPFPLFGIFKKMFNLKNQFSEKIKRIIAHFHRPPGAIFERFGNFP